MAGSVFSKIAERVYAKDLRLPLTNAIDTNSVVIPNVKAGEVREAQRVLEELEINVKVKLPIREKKCGEIRTLPRKRWFLKAGAICRTLCRA